MNNTKALRVKYTISRGQDTYGYNLVTLYVNGKKHNRTCGGGYDMTGTVIGEYITREYNDRLKELEANSGSLDETGTGYYGVSHYDNKENKWLKHANENTSTCLDGACGINCVKQVAAAIGLDLEYSHGFSTKNETAYYLTDNRA